MIWAKKRLPWTGLVLALGLGLRLYHFLRNPSMWHDEAALVLNVLDKGFLRLLGPLSFTEAAPPSFLWIERAVTLLLGDSTYALRLFPLLASCAALLIMVPVARRVLQPPAVPWALFLLACSDHILWHSCEAKPYAVDVFAATAVIAVFCGTTSWTLGQRLLVVGLVGPVLIFFVYPGCFLCGGLLVAFLPAVWQERQAKTWLGYGFVVLAIFTAFAFLLGGPVQAQRCELIVGCWKNNFPCWERPGSVPAWTTLSVLEVFRYCFEPLGQVLFLFAGAGVVSFWRRRSGTLLALLLVPILLPLAAAYFQAYPFGGSRVLVYAAPALALLIAEGLSMQIAADMSEHNPFQTAPPWSSRVGTWCRYGIAGLALAPLPWASYRAVEPWSRADCAGAAKYVLDHRQHEDAVAANHWEYAYYFRNLHTSFHLLEDADPALQGRLWLVMTAGAPAGRLAILLHFRQRGWRMLEQHDFTRTSVFLLSRTAS